MYPTDLTVAAVVHRDGYYLLVEEHAMGRIVLNQPGGHIEAGETAEVAVIREVLEETGCHVACGGIIGTYLWIQPQTRQQFLRIVFTAEYIGCDERRELDDSIIARCWLYKEEIEKRRSELRSPVVLRCVHDYESGRRQSDALLSDMLPLQNNVDAMLAQADLV